VPIYPSSNWAGRFDNIFLIYTSFKMFVIFDEKRILGGGGKENYLMDSDTISVLLLNKMAGGMAL
jgi:hypothetical protein